MNLIMDDALKGVAVFMQENLPTTKLVATAASLNAIAPLLWGHYDCERLTTLALVQETISDHDQRRQSGASE